MATRTAAPTKPDQTRRPELSINQLNAVAVLITGATDAEAATAANVTRQTISHWRHHDPVFQAELNQARAAIWSASTDQLRSLVPRALTILAAALAERPDPKLAMDLLRLAGIGGGANLGQAGIGPTTAAEFEAAAAEVAERAAIVDLYRFDLNATRRWED